MFDLEEKISVCKSEIKNLILIHFIVNLILLIAYIISCQNSFIVFVQFGFLVICPVISPILYFYEHEYFIMS